MVGAMADVSTTPLVAAGVICALGLSLVACADDEAPEFAPRGVMRDSDAEPMRASEPRDAALDPSNPLLGKWASRARAGDDPLALRVHGAL